MSTKANETLAQMKCNEVFFFCRFGILHLRGFCVFSVCVFVRLLSLNKGVKKSQNGVKAENLLCGQEDLDLGATTCSVLSYMFFMHL